MRGGPGSNVSAGCVTLATPEAETTRTEASSRLASLSVSEAEAGELVQGVADYGVKAVQCCHVGARKYNSGAVNQSAKACARSYQPEPNLRVREIADGFQEFRGLCDAVVGVLVTEFVGPDRSPKELETPTADDPVVSELVD